jgi:hypothetical protein
MNYFFYAEKFLSCTVIYLTDVTQTKRNVMLSGSEASRNQGKRFEHSTYGLPILADSSPRMTPFLSLRNISYLIKLRYAKKEKMSGKASLSAPASGMLSMTPFFVSA